VTSVASEAFALLNRPTPSSRAASSKSGQPDGGFADLMESQAERHDEPKPARAERSQSRRTERETPSDKPERVDAAASNDAPARTDDSKAADNAAEKPAAETSGAANPADETAPPADDKKVDDTTVVTGIVPALSIDTAVAAAIIPVVAAPVATTPVEAPAIPAEVAPLPAAAAAPATTPAATPSITTPTTAPDQQQSADPAGQATKPAETVATPATTPAVPGQEEAAAANAAQQAKPQTAPKSEKTLAGDTTTDTETNLETAQTEAPEDATQHAKHPAAQNTTPAQAQTHTDKPDVKTDLAFKPDDFVSNPKLAADHLSSQVPTHMPGHTTAAITATPQASPVSATQAIPVNAIAVEIAGQAKAGNSRFEIRLDPPELGRIDVRLDVDKDGNVTSRLVIERTDTYDLLRRDQSTLERALQQAGLKTSDNSLEFSLRDQGFAQQQRQNDDTPRGVRTLVAESDIMPSEAANGYARLLGGRSGVDIRV
jgi:flagellar hook-length control protein FliK